MLDTSIIQARVVLIISDGQHRIIIFRKNQKNKVEKICFCYNCIIKKEENCKKKIVSVTENLWPVKLADHIVFTCM